MNNFDLSVECVKAPSASYCLALFGKSGPLRGLKCLDVGLAAKLLRNRHKIKEVDENLIRNQCSPTSTGQGTGDMSKIRVASILPGKGTDVEVEIVQ